MADVYEPYPGAFDRIPLIERLRNFDWRGPVREQTAHQAADVIEALTEALAKARDTFRDYSMLHAEKCTFEGDQKAQRNADLAAEMSAALAKAKGA